MVAVTLVPYRPEYFDPFMKWRAETQMRRHNPLRALSQHDVRYMLETDGTDLSDLSKCKSYRWFVRVDDQVAGTVGLHEINLQMGTAELGYGIGESWQGRGLGTRAVRLLVDRTFRETSLRKIIAYVHEENIPSSRLLERLGFVREGLLREHFLIDGKPVNEVLFGLLRREWNQ